MKRLLIFFIFMVTCQIASAQILLSDFTDLANQYFAPMNGTWNGGSPAVDQYVQNVGSISIEPVNEGNPDGTGNFTASFQSGGTVDLTEDTTIALTAELISGNTDASFTVTIDNASLVEIGQATFATSLFNDSNETTVDVPLTIEGGGSITQATYWVLSGDDIPGDAVDATFFELEAVPEPSTYALFGVGLLLLFWLQRRKILGACLKAPSS